MHGSQYHTECFQQVYGIDQNARETDPDLHQKRRELIITAARALDNAHMIRFSEVTGFMNITDMVSQFLPLLLTTNVRAELQATSM